MNDIGNKETSAHIGAEPNPDGLAAAKLATDFHLPRGLVRRLYPLLTELWQILDALVVAIVFYALTLIHGIEFEFHHLAFLGVTAVLMFIIYSWSDLFYRLRTRKLEEEAWRLLQGWAMVLVLLLAIGYLTDGERRFARDFTLIWAGCAYIGQLLAHLVIREILHIGRKHGYNIRRVLAIGYGAPLDRYESLIYRNPWLGLRILGYVAEPQWLAENATASKRRNPVEASGPYRLARAFDVGPSLPATGGYLRHLGRLADIDRLVRDLLIDEIYVALPLERSADSEAVMQMLVPLPVNITWIPDFSLAKTFSTRSDTLDGQPLVLLSDSRIDRHGHLFKRTMDFMLSGALLVLLAPLMLAIALAIKWSSPGPIIFKQKRHGLGGKPILVWKFRTMKTESTTEAARQATSNDDRITPIGAWLRRTSLDELPQLINVLQGRMSLVGPRPHPLWLNDQFSQTLDAFMQRHRVKPGLTGWAQVNGFRGETDTHEKMEQRVSHDIYYITHWSPWLDFKILVLTIPAVLGGENAH